MTTETKRLTVKLCDRTVTIDPAEWPQVAEVRGGHDCGQHAQNGRTWWRVQVRSHADGRILIYLRVGGACQCSWPDINEAGYLLRAQASSDTELAQCARELVALGQQTGDDDLRRTEERALTASNVRRLLQGLSVEDL